MKLSVIQPDIAWEDKHANFQRLAELINPLLNKTDIVILPEMFNTGFSMDPERLCEQMDGETLHWMYNLAVEGNFGICGSFIVIDDGHYYNRWVFVSPEKEVLYYDKRHLFRMGGENRLFTPGKKRLTFNFRNTRINPYICYDLRFPVWSRSNRSTDLIIYSSNWPEARQNVWITLLKARAIENQCFVAGSNPTGRDGKGISYAGDSMIINPRGEIVASAGSAPESFATAEISISDLENFRNKFPVLDDADDFSLPD